MMTATGIHKSFGLIKAVQNVSVTIPRGTSLCVLGRSGCGKSTLLKIMGLILMPDKGELVIDSTRIANLNGSRLQRLRSSIGYSFQEPLLLPYLTALENICTIISPVKPTSSFDTEKEARRVLSYFGLSNRLSHYPSKLSVGEKKRVDLGRAVVKNPLILIADEPFSNLDPETSRMVIEILHEYVDNGGTLVYSSTDPRDSRFADETCKMSSSTSVGTKQSIRPLNATPLPTIA